MSTIALPKPLTGPVCEESVPVKFTIMEVPFSAGKSIPGWV